MRVENDSPSKSSAAPRKSFGDELKKLDPKAKPAPAQKPAAKAVAPKPVAAKPAAGKPGAAAGPAKAAPQKALAASAKLATRVAAAQQHLDAGLVRAVKASQSFESSLVERRAEAEVHRPEIKRVAAEIARLLTQDPQPRPQPQPALRVENAQVAQTTPPNVQPAAPQNAPPPARAQALAGQIEKLIERAELLSRAEGPALQLGLAEGSASSIEVVRTGKGEVALRLDARSGSDRRALAAKAGAIRDMLAQRGLRVREVRIC